MYLRDGWPRLVTFALALGLGCSSAAPTHHPSSGEDDAGDQGGAAGDGTGGTSGAGGSSDTGGTGGTRTPDASVIGGENGGTGGTTTSDAGDDDASAGTGGAKGDDGGVSNPSGRVLLVTGTDPQPAPDNGMKAELMAMGLAFDFHNSDTMPLTVQTAMGHALIIVSPNTPRNNIPASYKDLPIPIIVSKDGPEMQLAMASPPYTTNNDQKSIAIVAPDDPLAAGFPMGTVAVMGNINRMVNGMPSPAAKVVATLVGNPKAATIYYYTTGQMMLNGTKAPAKRVGFFWHRTEDATPDGHKLFRAAVEWALKP
jgi:hypothetical protein